ncbi:uncharacterized protein LOC131858542 [Cryptomeria japonica]|uniref:uncharacterized protein LOC131858542 n=1 Tax=Cryptomeria japonica TaxID=3369 RepID=UPI0027D9D71A|nr:uncharacterized protein LOC131858542 [Cryptomeria japonica]
MRITTWNVRGLSAPDKSRLVKRALIRLLSEIIMLQETKLNMDKASKSILSCKNWDGFFQEANGFVGGLAILWDPDKVSIKLIQKSENWIFCWVKFLIEDVEFPLCNVYGPTKTEDKLKVWTELSELSKISDWKKVLVAEDFNALLDIDEKKGGLRMTNRVMQDFREFVSNNNLFDVVPKNGCFTWTNRRAKFASISDRLDRTFVGPFWVESSFNLESCILPFSLSDHFPIEICINDSQVKVKGNFKFLSMWWRDVNFFKNLEEWWLESNIFVGTPSFCFSQRMKFTKDKIKLWNVASFKNIFSEKIRIEEELDCLNSFIMVNGMSEAYFLKEKKLKIDLAEIFLREEIYWQEKSRELWINVGDSNSKFFHASVKAKRGKNRIDSINNSIGMQNSKPEEIEEIAVEYFKQILGSEDDQIHGGFSNLLEVIYKEVTPEDNEYLMRPFTIKEIKEATFMLHPHKAPGPDGMTMKFF